MPGLLEILIIVFLALLFFGYEKIPELGRSLGIGTGEFKKSFKKAANLPGSPQGKEKNG